MNQPSAIERERVFWPYLASAFFVVQNCGVLSLLDRQLYGEWPGKGGDKLTQSLGLAMMVCTASLFLIGYRKTRTMSFGNIFSLVIMAFLLLSSLWSLDSPETIRRAVLYFFFMIGVIGISNCLDADDYMHMLWRIFLFSAVASLVLRVVYPASVLADEGELRGLFSHKNVLGQVMATGVLASLHEIRANNRPRWRFVVAIGVFMIAALEAKSGTAVMVIILFCFVDRVAALIARGGAARAMGLALLGAALPVIATFIIAPGLLLSALGKDPTLTGRTDLWPLVIDYISLKPVLGWGFGAFWSLDSPGAERISDTLGWVVPNAHNGILEILIEIGFVGALLFVSFLVRSIVIAFKSIARLSSAVGVTLLLCCVGLLFIGATEEVLIDPSQSLVSVFFITGFMCERMLASRNRDVVVDNLSPHTRITLSARPHGRAGFRPQRPTKPQGGGSDRDDDTPAYARVRPVVRALRP